MKNSKNHTVVLFNLTERNENNNNSLKKHNNIQNPNEKELNEFKKFNDTSYMEEIKKSYKIKYRGPKRALRKKTNSIPTQKPISNKSLKRLNINNYNLKFNREKQKEISDRISNKVTKNNKMKYKYKDSKRMTNYSYNKDYSKEDQTLKMRTNRSEETKNKNKKI